MWQYGHLGLDFGCDIKLDSDLSYSLLKARKVTHI